MIANNLTQTFREELYESILEKNLGFFDDRNHVPTVLTAAMAD
jgi:hypothetical protein